MSTRRSWGVFVQSRFFLSLTPGFSCIFHSKYHKSPITYGAIALSILSFFFGLGGYIPIFLGLVPLLIVLCTSCIRVPKAGLYTAAIAAIICSMTDFIIAARQPICNGADAVNCNSKAARTSLVIGGFLWIVSAVLIAKIPQRDATSSQSTFNQNQVAGHDAA
jgi:hypothetical protein